MATLLIGGPVITVDDERRILDPGAVAVEADRILAIGSPDELRARFPGADETDLSHAAMLPGLVDSHGHAGHGMTKALGDGADDWLDLVAEIYFRQSDVEFWRAEGFLSALEHIEFGVTTSLSMTGSMPRVDDPKYAVAASKGYADLGLRHIVALGPPNTPWPATYRDVESGKERTVDLDGMMDTVEATIDQLNGTANGRLSVFVGPSALVPEIDASGNATDQSIAMMKAVHAMSEDRNVSIHTHAYAGHLLAAEAAYPDILTPKLTLAHCAGISLDEVRIMADHGVNATHGPLTHAFASARFPLTEALEAGMNVLISTDGSGPDRSFDLLSQGRIAAQLQRAHFADTSILPAGKILEMMTIDPARAFGMDGEIGSLEAGKKADIIAVDLRSARMGPRFMPLERVIYVGSGLDVEFMMVDGKVLKQDHQIVGIDVDTILDDADRAARTTYERAGMLDRAVSHSSTWGNVRYQQG
ncbi:MAG: amidohydrolase family protein [Thermomicrobiales bacterium]